MDTLPPSDVVVNLPALRLVFDNIFNSPIQLTFAEIIKYAGTTLLVLVLCVFFLPNYIVHILFIVALFIILLLYIVSKSIKSVNAYEEIKVSKLNSFRAKYNKPSSSRTQ